MKGRSTRLGIGQRNGKMYYKIQKDMSKKYSGTGTRVIVNLGSNPYSMGPVPCSEARAWGVRVIFRFLNPKSWEKISEYGHYIGQIAKNPKSEVTLIS